MEKRIGPPHDTKGLWNPKNFYWLSIVFSFLSAAILYSLNFGRLGDTKKRNLSLVISIVSFGIMVLIGEFIPITLSKGLYIGVNAGAAVYMYKHQLPLYNQHIENGGKKASIVIPTIISTVLAASAVAAMLYTFNIPDDKITFKNSELYYTEKVSKEEAETLGNYLNNNGYFEVDKSVKLDKESNGYAFSLVVDKSYLDNEPMLERLKQVANLLSKEVFRGQKVHINLTDNRFNTLRTVTGD